MKKTYSISFIVLLFLLSFTTVYAQSNKNCFTDKNGTDQYCLDDIRFGFKARVVYYEPQTKTFSYVKGLSLENLYVRLPSKTEQQGAVISSCVTDRDGFCELDGYGKFMTGTFFLKDYNNYKIDPVGNSKFFSEYQETLKTNQNVEIFPDSSSYLYMFDFKANETYYIILYPSKNKDKDLSWTVYSNSDGLYGLSGWSILGDIDDTLLNEKNIQNNINGGAFKEVLPTPTATPDVSPTDEPPSQSTIDSAWIVAIFVIVLGVIAIIIYLIYQKIKKIDKEWTP